MFARIVDEHFYIPDLITDKDCNYKFAEAKKDVGRYKAGDRIVLRLDWVNERIYIEGIEVSVIVK